MSHLSESVLPGCAGTGPLPLDPRLRPCRCPPGLSLPEQLPAALVLEVLRKHVLTVPPVPTEIRQAPHDHGLPGVREPVLVVHELLELLALVVGAGAALVDAQLVVQRLVDEFLLLYSKVQYSTGRVKLK